LTENVADTVPRPRIESLSDLVFGLALSVGALSLLSKLPSNPAEVRSDIVAFAFSFLILTFVWLSYTRAMSVLPIETRATLVLNITMLFLVAIEPYLFYLVSLFGHTGEYHVVDYASVMYALDMGGLMAILAFFYHQLSVEERRLIPQKLIAQHKRIRNVLFISAGLFFLTVFPQFWSWQIDSVPLRLYLWLSPMAIAWISRGLAPNQTSAKG